MDRALLHDDLGYISGTGRWTAAGAVSIRGAGATLLENLLMLFRQVASDLHPVRVTTSAGEDGGVALGMATAIPGYRSEASLGPGCGLSIESARRVVEGARRQLPASMWTLRVG